MAEGQTARKINKPIVLLGMMGAGKSSLGMRLADALGVAFHDSDSEIETAAQMTVADIFEKHGEDAFRDGERRVIARLLKQGTQVLALGGGAFIDPQTRKLISQSAISICLEVPLDELVKRVEKKPDKRPLLAGQDVRAKLTELLEQRAPIYAEADMRVDVGGGTHEQAVARLLDALDKLDK